jgi:hypothetical protein
MRYIAIPNFGYLRMPNNAIGAITAMKNKIGPIDPNLAAISGSPIAEIIMTIIPHSLIQFSDSVKNLDLALIIEIRS